MKAEDTKTLISFEDASKKNWFLSYRKAAPQKALKIEFNDGRSYEYLSKVNCEVGDTAVIDFGGATSYSMGQVVNVEDNKTLKPAKAVRTLFIFSDEPTKKDLKNNAADKAIQKYDWMAEHRWKGCCIIDHFVKNVLDAITVIAFPELSGKAEITAAKKYLKTSFKLPAEFFAKDYFSQLEFCEACGDGNFSFSGFYPGWLEDFKSKSFFTADLGDECTFEDFVDEKNSQFNNYEVVYSPYEKKLIKLLKSDPEMAETVNELVYRSALSILIRGGFVNLLKAALTVEMPIGGFYDKLVDFAKEIGSDYCYEVLVENK